MQVFGAGSSAWYTDECQAVERSVRIGVLPGMTEKPRVQIPPGPPKTGQILRGVSRENDTPPGGSRIVNKRTRDDIGGTRETPNIAWNARGQFSKDYSDCNSWEWLNSLQSSGVTGGLAF